MCSFKIFDEELEEVCYYSENNEGGVLEKGVGNRICELYGAERDYYRRNVKKKGF